MVIFLKYKIKLYAYPHWASPLLMIGRIFGSTSTFINNIAYQNAFFC